MLLHPFWVHAARVGNATDLSWAREVDPEGLDASGLRARGLGFDQVQGIAEAPPLEVAHQALTLRDTRYPTRLATITCPPPVLFFEGDLRLLERRCLAIVGTRSCTGRGRAMAQRLARRAADHGWAVVSGLARGIDTAAHEAAPAVSVAVLGQGLGSAMSHAQLRLANSILQSGGLVISEFLPGTPPNKGTFPRRNRVIAGLAQSVVVVEAPHRSGALITARWAIEFGRDLGAVPGHPEDQVAQGCLRLIRDGAQVVIDGSEVGLDARPVKDPLLAAIGDGGNVDEIAVRTGRSAAEVARALAALELRGLLARGPGGRYAPR